MTDRQLTPHGYLLDRARIALGISQREAARRAKISEGRWRQVVTGVQRQGGVAVPVNPKAATVSAMARAVEADVPTVLAAAGLEPVAEFEDEREADALAELRDLVAELREVVRRLEGSA